MYTKALIMLDELVTSLLCLLYYIIDQCLNAFDKQTKNKQKQKTNNNNNNKTVLIRHNLFHSCSSMPAPLTLPEGIFEPFSVVGCHGQLV